MSNMAQVKESICGKLVLRCIGENELPCTCYKAKGRNSFYLKDDATGRRYAPFNFRTALQLMNNKAPNMELIG